MTDRDDTAPHPDFIIPPHAAYPGVTLRDWFAGQALAGLCAFPGRIKGEYAPTAALHSALAYEYADAMIDARKEKPNGK